MVVSCDEEKFEDDNLDVLLNPVVIIEILSDSTEAYDRGLKFFFHYQFIYSLTEYLLVSQKFERQKDNTGVYSEFHDMDDVVEIKSVGCTVPLKEIYRRVSVKVQIV